MIIHAAASLQRTTLLLRLVLPLVIKGTVFLVSMWFAMIVAGSIYALFEGDANSMIEGC